MTERVIDLCETRLGRGKPTKATTAQERRPGGDFTMSSAELQARVQQSGITVAQAERLARLYGSEAFDVLARGSGASGEAEQAVLVEGASTLEDWWVRRAARAWFENDADALREGAERMATLLGWSADETARQVVLCRSRVLAG